MASTAHEVLVAELLGDVGKLHDAIKSLPKALGPVCGAIVKTARDAQSTIDGYAQAQEEKLKIVVATELRAAAQEIQRRQAKAAGYFRPWLVMVLLAVASASSAFLGYKGARASEVDATNAAYGRAVAAAWNELDDDARALIEEEVRNGKR